jgi:RimJ/RimL family protein N-acetyltransferase
VSGDAPVLVTERLELWRPTKDDLGPMYEVVSHAQTRRFLGPQEGRSDHFLRYSRNAGSWFLYGYGAFILRERGGSEVLGNCGVFHSWRGLGADFDDSPEAGWILRHDKVGQGLAHEGMIAALAWFEREHGARRVVCMVSDGNEPSLRLAGKLGFTPMRDAVLPDGDMVRLFERVPV